MTVQLDARPPVAPKADNPRPSWGRLSRLDTRYSPYLYVAPFFLLFAVFGAYPLAYTFWVSLHDWDLLGTDHPFVGAENYTRLLADTDFWHALVNTLRHLRDLHGAATARRALAGQPAQPAPAGPHRWRMAVLVPNVTSTAAVAIVFGVLFGREFGMINWLLDLVGRGRDRLEIQPVRLLGGHLRHGRLAVDRLQRADPAGRDAGHPPRSVRGRGDRRRQPGPTVLVGHRATAQADDHLLHDHRHHRRAAALHRAPAVPLRHQPDPRRPAARVADPDHVHVRERLRPALQLRVRLGGRLAALRAHRDRRGGQRAAPAPARRRIGARRTEGSRRDEPALAGQPAHLPGPDRRGRPIDLSDLVDARRRQPLQRCDGSTAAPDHPRRQPGREHRPTVRQHRRVLRDRPDQFGDRRQHGHHLRGVLLQPGRVRLRQAAVPWPQRPAAGDHRDHDGADPARRDPALPAHDQAALERPAARGDRAGRWSPGSGCS